MPCAPSYYSISPHTPVRPILASAPCSLPPQARFRPILPSAPASRKDTEGTRGGGFGPTVGVADGDCRSGDRLPRRWVGRQPSFDPARAAVHSAQRFEVCGSDSWRVLTNPKSAHRFEPEVRSLRVVRNCAQQRNQQQKVSTARTIPGQRGRAESRGNGGDRLVRRPPLLISVGPPDDPCCTARTD